MLFVVPLNHGPVAEAVKPESVVSCVHQGQLGYLHRSREQHGQILWLVSVYRTNTTCTEGKNHHIRNHPDSEPVLLISLISAGTEKIKPLDTVLGKLQFYH
jgi:hypothetical protein